MTLNSENLKQNSELIENLAALLHEEWRKLRKNDSGIYKPKIRKTQDIIWSKKHDTHFVDLANTDFCDLPKDWQKDNWLTAELIIEELISARRNNLNFDDEFIEDMSAFVHRKRMLRSGLWISLKQRLPFFLLSKEEKAKDKVMVNKAIELFLAYEKSRV